MSAFMLQHPMVGGKRARNHEKPSMWEETESVLSSQSILMITNSFPTIAELVHSGRQGPGDMLTFPHTVNTFAVEIEFPKTHSNHSKHLMCLGTLSVSLSLAILIFSEHFDDSFKIKTFCSAL